MILLKREEWKQVWSVARIVLVVLLGSAFLIGFGVGAINSEKCEYTNLASRMNLGYVAGCEMYRHRWAQEKKCVNKTIVSMEKKANYYNMYMIVYEDGTTADAEIPSNMLGKQMRVCE